MTPEQIELEFEHLKLDLLNSKGNTEHYTDEDYEAYEQEVASEAQGQTIPQGSYDDEAWEDVEIDDLE